MDGDAWTRDGKSDVADSTALQGFRTQTQYLKLTNWSNRPIECTDGRIEVLPMPTREHRAISRFLFPVLYSFVQGIGGNVFYAPLRLRIREGKFRDPDPVCVPGCPESAGADRAYPVSRSCSPMPSGTDLPVLGEGRKPS